MEAHNNLSAIIDASHENKWVAIAPDYSHVINSSNNLADLMRAVNDKDAIFHRVLPRNVSFVPTA
jgi:hypothetical protein